MRENMTRKARAAAHMFDELVAHMQDAERLRLERNDKLTVEVPAWARSDLLRAIPNLARY